MAAARFVAWARIVTTRGPHVAGPARRIAAGAADRTLGRDHGPGPGRIMRQLRGAAEVGTEVVTSPKQRLRFARSHDGVRLAYAVSGSGPTLIKAATWLSHLEYDWESPVWRHLLRELSRARHASCATTSAAAACRTGRSTTCRFDSWVRDLETVVDALGVERFALLGISQGASIAIAYAVRHPRARHAPGAARRLCARPAGAQRHAAAARRGRDDVPAGRARLGQGRPVVPPVLHHASSSPAARPSSTAGSTSWSASRPRRPTRRASCASSTASTSRALLPQVRCPTLVLHSRRDVRVPFAEGRLIASAIPGARFVPIDSGNHLLLEHEAAGSAGSTRCAPSCRGRRAMPIACSPR